MSLVHFASSEPGSPPGIGGIVEFMSPKFRRQFHPHLGKDPSTWRQSRKVKKVACMPLSLIFSQMKVTHINYFSLDVEGAELAILKSIDFKLVRFDVISVETEKAYRPLHYEANVTELLTTHGYLKIWCKGRNSWFRHRDFETSSRYAIEANPLRECA